MKKTLITLAALALSCAANAVTISNDLKFPTTGTMNLTTSGAHATGYTFTFQVTGEVSTDTIVAAYWNNIQQDYANAFAFIVDSDTQTLSVSLGTKSNTTDTTWSAYSDPRLTTFKIDGVDVVLTKGYTYTVTLTSDNVVEEGSDNWMTSPTLSWTDEHDVLHTSTITYKGNMNANTSLSWSSTALSAVPEPATATLSLLALAGLAARRRRK